MQKVKEGKKEKWEGIGFWVASLTWGCLMTLIGAIIALAMLVIGKKPRRFHYFIYFSIGEYWGGFNCGPFIFIDGDTAKSHERCVKAYGKGSGWALRMIQHETGHGLQNIMLGVFMPFVIAIPSCIRYWYRELRYYRRGKEPKTEYDAIWFEGWATNLGVEHYI